MSILELGSLQLTLFAMMLIGALLKKKDIIDENGKKCLADLCINVVIPRNIFKSCLIELDAGVLKSCAMLLVSAVVMQLLCLALNRFLFDRYDPQRKKVLQYCTIVPMSGFLGNPIAEGIYNEVGVLYTSIFLIPMRIVMWSVGTTYFVAGETVEKRKVIKNVLTHPCLVAIYLGLLCMVTQVQLPSEILNSVEVYRELQLRTDDVYCRHDPDGCAAQEHREPRRGKVQLAAARAAACGSAGRRAAAAP